MRLQITLITLLMSHKVQNYFQTLSLFPIILNQNRGFIYGLG